MEPTKKIYACNQTLKSWRSKPAWSSLNNNIDKRAISTKIYQAKTKIKDETAHETLVQIYQNNKGGTSITIQIKDTSTTKEAPQAPKLPAQDTNAREEKHLQEPNSKPNQRHSTKKRQGRTHRTKRNQINQRATTVTSYIHVKIGTLH